MNTRTLALLGAVVVVASVGAVRLGDGTSQTAMPASLSPLASFPAANTARAAAREMPRPDDAGPVRVAGLMINAPVHGSDPASTDRFDVDLAFFGTFERTRLALELELPDGGILGIDGEASAVERFHDDRGTDLRKKDDSFGPFEMMPRVSADGRYLVFHLPSDKLPATGARELFAAGTVAVQVAHDAETFTTAELALAKGTTFSAGGYAFEIQEVGDSAWGDGRSITLRTKRDPVAVVRYALLAADGTEIELSPSMSMSGMGSWQQTLDAETTPARARFVVEAWQDLETVELPFEVTAGMGLR
jgi:hypothetical protein